MDTVLFFIHYGFLLAFGIALSAVFAGVRSFSSANLLLLCGLYVGCGTAQLVAYALFDEELVWKLYPLIAHLPIVLVLLFYYRKRLVTALAAVSTAYLCCQPAKWFGLMLEALTGSHTTSQAVRILVLAAVGFVAIRYLSACISEIYNKDPRSVCIFGIVPMVYYLFDYSMSVYSDLWTQNLLTVVEFLPFFLCAAYLIFCVIYFQQYEQKADAQRKEQLIRITTEQQAKEITAIKRSEHEVRLLRHDMRLFLNNLSLCIENNDVETARKMIAGISASVDATVLQRYCKNDTINYVLSNFAARCQEQNIRFIANVQLVGEPPEEILFSTILSNALDNALNAQKELPESKRSIRLMLKTSNGKTLLSVQNPFAKRPDFADGIPVSRKPGHGYGTQSIRYMTERLGGNCMFSTEEDRFLLRVVI